MNLLKRLPRDSLFLFSSFLAAGIVGPEGTFISTINIVELLSCSSGENLNFRYIVSLSQWTLKKNSLNIIFPTKYVIPKSLKFSNWLSQLFSCIYMAAASKFGQMSFDKTRIFQRGFPANKKQTFLKVLPCSITRTNPWAHHISSPPP